MKHTMNRYAKVIVAITALACVAQAVAQEVDCTAQNQEIGALKQEVSAGIVKQTELETQLSHLKTQLKTQQETLTQQYEQKIKQYESAQSGLLNEKKAIESDRTSAKKAVTSLEASLKQKDGIIAKLKEELEVSIKDVDSIKAALEGAEGDLCLPKPVSKALLSTWKSTKPKVIELYTKATEKAVPMMKDTSELVKAKVSDAASKAYVIISPYYGPLAEKVDEATKPYQPKAKEVYDTVKGHVTFAVEKGYEMGNKQYEVMKPKVAEAMTKVKPLTEKVASTYEEYVKIVTGHVITFSKSYPQLQAYVHEGNESMIMNTLFYIPLVTLALILYSKLRGKKKQKKPVVSSPGRPAFKPGTGSPFKATPKAKAYGKRK